MSPTNSSFFVASYTYATSLSATLPATYKVLDAFVVETYGRACTSTVKAKSLSAVVTFPPGANAPGSSDMTAPSAQGSERYRALLQFHGSINLTGTAVVLVTYTKVNYPVVVLNKANRISSLQYSGTTAELCFDDDAAYQVAAPNWANHPYDYLFLVYSPTCGIGYSRSERDWLLVGNIFLEPTSKKITCVFTVVEVDKAVGENNEIKPVLGNESPNGKSAINLTGEALLSDSNSSGPDGSRPSKSSGISDSTSTLTGKNATGEDFDVRLDKAIGYDDPNDLGEFKLRK
ncbi:MAG: hypothetical protein M1814_001901 [Vezdaea aestivalis]|nr:MAG: hypothetical protein M1814_001901 [Vezdaea aestivalis]